MRAMMERREHGIRKYGRALETDNGRDALQDAWEEALDLLTYLTQMRLERGHVLPGMEAVVDPQNRPRGPRADLVILDEANLIPSACGLCGHQPHVPGGCLDDSPSGRVSCSCGATCGHCRHAAHEPGHCRSQALNLGCGCLGPEGR